MQYVSCRVICQKGWQMKQTTVINTRGLTTHEVCMCDASNSPPLALPLQTLRLILPHGEQLLQEATEKNKFISGTDSTVHYDRLTSVDF